MYYDDKGVFKGEALVMYFKEGSVDLAITLLDDTELELGSGFGNMRVRVAEYEKSASNSDEKKVPAVESGKNGESSGSASKNGGGGSSGAAIEGEGGDAGPSNKEKKKLAFEEKAKMSKRIKTMQK